MCYYLSRIKKAKKNMLKKYICERKKSMNKITIIGTGSVGSTIAYTLTIMGLASEIVMIDINQEKSLGEALDIR
ncbi:MAG: L-lactate dehydrogenase, partial [Phascolarctobacterium sp.]|nr:L-lactate dehydrogenase [Phascolarctobacterium sp.]